MINIDVDGLCDPVSELLRCVGREELLPRYESLDSSPRMKSPGEVVTDADLSAEAALTDELRALTPNAEIVGEEGASADPSLLRGLDRHEWVWIVDPLDGTRHFAEGVGPFGSMVALLRLGVCEAAWIHLPLTGEMAYARRGGGAFLNGERISIPPPPRQEALRGGLLTRFFPEPLKSRAESSRAFERTEGAHGCAARRYVDLLTGREHFSAYWRTLPWDHAPGALIVQEAGGVARRFNGDTFRAGDVDATSLLVASDTATWDLVRARALGA